jgi:pyruvate,orthophosphate dikinase
VADNFGLKIGIEGEKEFKNAIREINQSFKVLGSEMNLVASQFDKQDKSVEAVTARNKVLNKEIELQKEKIATLEKALANAASSFGETDRRTQSWQIQLNNAKAELNKMERELEQSAESADELGDELKESGDNAEKSSSKFEKLGSVLKGVGAAMGAAAAAAGAASGSVVFDADEAEKLGKEGQKVILVRTETTPDDIHGLVMSQGVLTSRGGMTSHAAVVARGMGKPAVCGCEGIKIDYQQKLFTVGAYTLKEGDVISIDGSTGHVMLGQVPTLAPELGGDFAEFLGWADEIRTLGVRANADTPEDAKKAREFGAAGIGLTRTEHMFMQQERLPFVQQMIMAETAEERQKALDKLLEFQQEDFYGILKEMEGYPVCIRLLDPPLHEFLPNREELLVEITRLKCTGGDPALIKEKETLLKKVESLHEFNPMLGHRGCRLGITYPEIYAMQARAIFQATAQLTKEGVKAIPEVEIPLVIHVNELAFLRNQTIEIAEQVMAETGVKFEYTVGTMIEVPRAALTADEVAREADFFSFGTNDLTQTTFGFSRDDAEGKFLQHYIDRKVLKENPFVTIDPYSVGKLMDMAVKLGRSTKPGLLIGICGEHGGDPESIEICYKLGLDFVSCSAFRVPIARLAAAQAAVKHPR